MNKRIISLIAAALALLSASGQKVEFTGTVHSVVIDTLSNNHTSLNRIYVLYDTVGVTMTYTATSDEPVVWSCYETRGSEDEPIDVIHEGRVTTLHNVKADKGYIIKEGTTPFYCWVVNYSKHYMSLDGFTYINEDPCGFLSFDVDGHADEIHYYEIDGNRKVLDRQIKLSYKTQEWDSISSKWKTQSVVENFESLDGGIQISQPLCNTSFTLTGDRFLEKWGLGKKKDINDFETQAVRCHTTAVQEGKDSGSDYGGSAPVKIVFTGYSTELVSSSEWELATDPEFEEIIKRYYEDEAVCTFTEPGTYYMRYTVKNDDESCRYEESYVIPVDDSYLSWSNVYSPGQDGSYVWKFTYKSVFDFHCWIFNRWGNLVCEFTDPDSGWDGTYRGKPVDTGVFYFVVTYTGTDGKKHTERQDITVLNYKGASSSGPDVSTGGN